VPRWGRDRSDDERTSADQSYADEDAHPLHDSGFEFEEHRRRSGRRRVVGCLLPVVLVGGLGYGGWKAYEYLSDYFGGETCLLRSGEEEEKLDPEQAANAATISTLATLRRDLPPRAAHIGISTAIQESKLRNLTSGDRDSVGLFQQRPSQGWGTAEQINDPVYSAGKFYDALVKVDQWQTRPLTKVAQDVQRSGHPDAYADHDGEGRVMSEGLTGASGATVGCRIDAIDTTGDPAQLASKLREQTGVRATAGENALTVRADSTRAARAIGAWAVAHAKFETIHRVTVGDREWVRERGRGGWSWHPAEQPTGSDQVVRIAVR
jgi:hypothetical protein